MLLQWTSRKRAGWRSDYERGSLLWLGEVFSIQYLPLPGGVSVFAQADNLVFMEGKTHISRTIHFSLMHRYIAFSWSHSAWLQSLLSCEWNQKMTRAFGETKVLSSCVRIKNCCLSSCYLARASRWSVFSQVNLHHFMLLRCHAVSSNEGHHHTHCLFFFLLK